MKPSLLLVLFVFAGCAAMSPGPTIAAMQVDRRCHAWFENGTGHLSTRVEQEQAIFYSGLGESPGATFRPAGGGDVVMRDTSVGSYAPRVLMLSGVSSPITIGAESATVHLAGGEVVVQYNRACSDRDAALAVASVFVAITRQHWRH